MKCGSTWYPSSWGGGIRFFGDHNQSALLLDDPEIVPGDRVTHLTIESGSDDHAAISGLPIASWSRVMHEKAGWAS
jgi:hypothetical protein